MKNWARLSLSVVLVCAVATAAGCKNKADAGGSADSSSTGGGAPSIPPTVSTTSPFALKMFTIYDNQSYVNQLIFQESGTDTCSVDSTTPTRTCTVVVPEGRLFFSSLGFQYSWLPSKCSLMTFQPYFYQASNAPNYAAPGATTLVDCSVRPTPSSCYAGAAVDLVPGFPQNASILSTPDETSSDTPNSATVKVNSGWSHRYYWTNRWTVNDMASAKISVGAAPSGGLAGAGDGYVANTYVNYSFSCRDHWYDPESYHVDLVVKDEDSMSGNTPVNDFTTWKER